jgi:NTE family protein
LALAHHLPQSLSLTRVAVRSAVLAAALYAERSGVMCVALSAALCTALFAATPARADDTATSATNTPRPRVALVLSGGGARGFAHVGVLRALRDMRVPVDIITGASMGAVVGGAYAAGRSVDDLEQFVRATDWASIVSDRPPRDDLAFRRREDDLLVPSRLEFGLDRSGVRLPPAAVANTALEGALARLLPPGSADTRADRLAVPFRCVASDLLSGELVELSDTPLFSSLRASLAMPGVFAPIRVRGRLLVDGGLVRNLPVDIARAMGADIVIAVNVGTPLSGEDQLGSSLQVATQMLHILTEQNVQRSLRELRADDILIAPELQGVSFMAFDLAERAMAAGERAARALAPRLQKLAVTPAAYAAFDVGRTRAGAVVDSRRTIDRLEVRGTPHADSRALAAQLDMREGQSVTTAMLRQAAAPLLGSGDFERVEIDLRDVDGERRVIVTPVEAPWARSRMRVGLELNSDFDDDHQFTVSALHVLSWLNPWGAELRTLARIGAQRSLATQWWQPLAPGSPWHVAPSIGYRAASIDLYDNGQRLARYGYEVGVAAMTLGYQFGHWGNVQLGIERRVGSASSLFAGTAAPVDAQIGETARFVRVQVDTLDSLALPGRGYLLQGALERARGPAAGEAGDEGAGKGERTTSSWIGLYAFRAGDWASHVYGEWARSHSGVAPLSLGGFLRLSGTPRESLSANTIVLGRLVTARRLGEMPAGLGGALRAGFSLEFGRGYDSDSASVRTGDLQRAGSAFVSVDTRFGPVFLAAGATRGVGSRLYLFLGPFW